MAEKNATIGRAEPVGKPQAGSGVAPTPAVSQVSRTEAVQPKDAVAGVAAAESVSAVRKVAANERVAASDRVQDIAERLRRGLLAPSQAVEELIEDAVQRNLPGLTADSALAQELRELLAAYAKDDPYLANRISRLDIKR